MLRKIFIVVNLESKNKKHIYNTISKMFFLEEAIEKVDFENYHLILRSFSNVDDEYLGKTFLELKNKLINLNIFDLNFNKLEWGPKPNNPKMLWLTGEKNNDLVNLRFQVENILTDSNVAVDKKNFFPHINLGRVISNFKKKHNELPQLDQTVDILIPVFSVDIVESCVENRKKKYRLLDSVELG